MKSVQHILNQIFGADLGNWWVIDDEKASGGLATVTKAAEPGKIHVVTGVNFNTDGTNVGKVSINGVVVDRYRVTSTIGHIHHYGFPMLYKSGVNEPVAIQINGTGYSAVSLIGYTVNEDA